MIEINLLPKELRKKKKNIDFDFSLNIVPAQIAPTQKEQFALVGLGISLLIFVLGTSALLFTSSSKQRKLNRLNKEWAQIKDEYEYVKKLEQIKVNMIKRKNFIAALMSKRLLWAKKLNKLSKALPEHVWLETIEMKAKTEKKTIEKLTKDRKTKKIKVSTEIITVKYFVLAIKGAVTHFGNSEMVDLVAKFMNGMRDEESFSKDFEEINLISTWRDSIDDIEIMRFSLECRFKEGVI